MLDNAAVPANTADTDMGPALRHLTPMHRGMEVIHISDICLEEEGLCLYFVILFNELSGQRATWFCEVLWIYKPSVRVWVA